MKYIGCREVDLQKIIRENEDKGCFYYNHVVDSMGWATVWFREPKDKFERIDEN